MLRGKINYLPDLDVLDSPLGSPVPFTAAFSIPGSALAERIFNDPDSWEDTDVEEGDFPEDVMMNDQMAWLTEEIEKFRASSAGIEPSIPFEVVFDKDSKDKGLIASPADDGKVDADSWKGIGKRKSVRPISLAALFDRPNDEFSADIQQQLSKILDSGGIRHQVRPLSSAMSPPSSSDTNSTIDTPLHVHSASSISSSGSRLSSPSPINIHSASATLSFLEWYGIYPDTPKLDTNARRSIIQRRKSKRNSPVLHIPSPRHASRPSPLISSSTSQDRVSGSPPAQSISANPPGLQLPSAPVPSGVETIESSKPALPPGLSRTPSPQVRKKSPVLLQPPAPAPTTELPALPSQLVSQTPIPTAPITSRSNSRARPPLPSVAPPAYTRTSSPAPRLVRDASTAGAQVTRSQTSVTASHTRTPSADSSSQRRRLPCIPPEPRESGSASVSSSRAATPVSRATTPPQPSGMRRGANRRASPPSVSTTTLPQGSPLNTSTPMTSLLRSASSVRTPLAGPAGPRTRGKGGCETPSPSRKLSSEGSHRPAVLRL
ncbi:hypothetical protein BJ165DRAFT_381646 [Panaeolus papilionaceus]|nr:hypothetical protein BJ165DRAFT_381646 [Panaeolus papilionaceus]